MIKLWRSTQTEDQQSGVIRGQIDRVRQSMAIALGEGLLYEAKLHRDRLHDLVAAARSAGIDVTDLLLTYR
ncbi:hypothetical protein D5S17_21555 [Pseudonocardiaceae bacterium YIM PH 21723]|nr:hypothetical protein D5S17_21555 [Pseudonocardiaceae bacterium YIM PH 21723]